MQPEIWFDDGLYDVYIHFAPLMKKYNFVGIISVVTDCVGGKFKWYYNYNSKKYIELRCMTIEELKILMANGWKIASHTKTHRRLTELSLGDAEIEFKKSKEWIEKNLGVTPEDLVCPWNEITEEQKKIALKYYKRIAVKNRMYFHAINLPYTDDVFTLDIFDSIIKKLVEQ